MPEVSVEEFIEGEEYTFDTICADGRDPLLQRRLVPPASRSSRRSVEWISPQTVALRDLDRPAPAGRHRSWACRCSKALGFRTGFTHMEWFLKPDGEAVFGEIGGAPAGRALDRAS